ncbi:UDP-GlcNAc:undecaprenyl-phosphate GlcNAc-1-phosphate transferase [Marinobacter pelagius]|uniref:Undecaprenyl-phosphate alpha-N-acetylglucosaminyl 1-phosphate transferase n=1 Tax=Marinobacter pelagius TaxID=379482 RepID=A0A366GDP4_9GAMM|nr:UDP-N-acetylglucosamine--undecaprenyl-phosphate N-acetylglucosaminephosphotransferase [Marinobacter pelagius]RBP25008.1 UDP-GlcNAc:undecaprenyl-phosphate GlcNAc-1-phosphate transferase [Marinobacter pelagius]
MEAASSTGLLAGLIAFVSLFVLKPVAVYANLLDKPDHRKLHKGAIPLTGGLSAFLGLGVAWLFWMPVTQGYGLFLFCAALLVLMGAVDDARDLSAKFRLGAQVALGALLTFGSGISLESFGNLFGFGEVTLGLFGPLVTIAAVIGATNAFNMIDGIDGLAGSLSLITLLSLAILFGASAGFTLELALSLGIAFALVPYLMANLRIPPFRRKIFMGDAGSMFIGFAVVWLLVNGTQPGEMAFRPVTALWIIALPLMDMVAIMVRRARKGQSVMKPDREHLHHIFMRAGFSDREALILITVIGVVFAGFGLAGEYLGLPEWLMFTAFVGVFALYDWALSHSWRLLVVFRRSHSHNRA